MEEIWKDIPGYERIISGKQPGSSKIFELHEYRKRKTKETNIAKETPNETGWLFTNNII